MSVLSLPGAERTPEGRAALLIHVKLETCVASPCWIALALRWSGDTPRMPLSLRALSQTTSSRSRRRR